MAINDDDNWKLIINTADHDPEHIGRYYDTPQQ